MNVVLQITKCPICGTSYHWPSFGKGNCPTCEKLQGSFSKETDQS